MDEALFNLLKQAGASAGNKNKKEPQLNFMQLLDMLESAKRDEEDNDSEDECCGCDTQEAQAPSQPRRATPLDMIVQAYQQPTANANAQAKPTANANAQAKEEPPVRATPYDMIVQGEVLYVYMEVPGVRKSDIDITLGSENEMLVGIEKRPPETGYPPAAVTTLVKERKYGYINRSIQLPKNVMPLEITARYEDGVLAIRCPFVKMKMVEQKRIKVE